MRTLLSLFFCALFVASLSAAAPNPLVSRSILLQTSNDLYSAISAGSGVTNAVKNVTSEGTLIGENLTGLGVSNTPSITWGSFSNANAVTFTANVASAVTNGINTRLATAEADLADSTGTDALVRSNAPSLFNLTAIGNAFTSTAASNKFQNYVYFNSFFLTETADVPTPAAGEGQIQLDMLDGLRIATTVDETYILRSLTSGFTSGRLTYSGTRGRMLISPVTLNASGSLGAVSNLTASATIQGQDVTALGTVSGDIYAWGGGGGVDTSGNGTLVSLAATTITTDALVISGSLTVTNINTNAAYASALTILGNKAFNTYSVTGAVTGNLTFTFSSISPGSSGTIHLRSDGSARTISFAFAGGTMTPVTNALGMNGSTQLVTIASADAAIAWHAWQPGAAETNIQIAARATPAP